jgi:AcrR family transcriptional regulator
MTMADAPVPERKPRADVARNRERLLAAAKRVFAHGGAGASLEAIAREAGLGIGTLYRHFPTREALYEGVYGRDIDQLVALAGTAATADDPVEGLRRWLHAAIDMVATKKGMIAALAIGADASSAISARLSGRLNDAVEPLFARAVDAGRLRADMSAQDLLLALVGMCLIRHEAGWQARVARMIDTLLAGLATGR